MSKKELETLLSPTFAWDVLGESGSPKEGREELLDVMVVAYNQAVDDAVGKLNEQGFIGLAIISVKKLKI